MSENKKKKSLISRFIYNVATSGKFPDGLKTANDLIAGSKYILLNALLVSGSLALLSFAGWNIYRHVTVADASAISLFIVDVVVASVCLTTLGLARSKISYRVPAVLIVTVYTIFVQWYIYKSMSDFASPLVAFLQAPLALHIIGGTLGIIVSLASWLSTILILVFTASDFYLPRDLTNWLGFLSVLVFVSIVIYRQSDNLVRMLKAVSKQVAEEHKEMEVMKDSLETGIFMLNEALEIQPLYSKRMSEILERTDLDNVSFTSLFDKLLDEKRLKLISTYLKMVKDADDLIVVDLDDMNPLTVVEYPVEGTLKTLKFTFAQTIKSGETFILGTVVDITAEMQAQAQLQEEARVHQEELELLFEVINAPVQVLEEYIEDTDQELETINGILKSTHMSEKEKITKVFQSVHSMKSDALILGLESVGKQFHLFEDKLTRVLRQDEISYEDMLQLIFMLNDVLLVKDKFSGAVEKLITFSKSSKTSLSALERIVVSATKKAAESNNIEIEPSIDGTDWELLPKAIRKSLKDVMVQLIRNSAAHAFNPERTNTLSVKVDIVGNTLSLTYVDNGEGIDFEKVKEKAIQLGLVPVTTMVTDKNALLKAMISPQFSTANTVTAQAGRGIGLSLVAEKVGMHKGTLTMNSIKGQGTKFVVKIPLDTN